MAKPIFIIEISDKIGMEILVKEIKESKTFQELNKDYRVLVFIVDRDDPKFTVMGEGEFSSSELSKRADEIFDSEKEEEVEEYTCNVCFDKGTITCVSPKNGENVVTIAKCRCKEEKA